MDAGDLSALAAEGNEDLAIALLARLPECGRAAALRAVRVAVPTPGRVYAPLVREDFELTAAVGVAHGHSAVLGPAARAAAKEAIAAAAALAGAPESETRGMGARLDLPERLGWSVDGDSLFLPVLLEAVAHLGGLDLSGSLVATGSFATPLAELARKVAASRAARATLAHGPMLVATAAQVEPAPDLVQCTGPEDAVWRAFGRTPWHPACPDVRRLLLYCGASDDTPALHPSSETTREELPRQLLPEHLDAVARQVRADLEPEGRWLLEVKGPVILAAWLGLVLANAPREVQFVDGHTNSPWWGNRAGRFHRGGAFDRSTAQRRVILSKDPLVPPPAWEVFPLPNPVAAGQVAGLLREFLDRYRHCDALHVAVNGPQALAFALASVLQGSGLPAHFCHFDRSRPPGSPYEEWFSNLAPAP